MNKTCLGCGTKLQSTNQLELGYIPESKKDSNYCERCFKIQNYNEKLILPLDNINDYIIEEINKTNKYCIFLIDLLNINEETINTYKSIKNNKTLIISKLDIIPKSMKESKIKDWLKKEYKITEDIAFQSTKKNINTSVIYKLLEKNNQKECYILGYTNAGKSTLINKLCTQNNLLDNKITTSLIPNTTIDFINIKLNDDLTIIDSPGFTLKNTLYDFTELELMNNIIPKKEIKPITYQTKDITSIIIEDKIRLKTNNKNSLTFYMSNNIKLDKVFKNNEKLLDQEEKTYQIKENSDLVIKGIGFINIKKPCKLKINTKYQDLIEVRNALF